MSGHLNEFTEHVRNAPTNPQSEKIVRIMLERAAKSCPIDALVQLGQSLVDCRRSELRNAAEQNGRSHE